MSKKLEEHCWNCKHFEEVYVTERNEDGLFDRVLDDVICTSPDKDEYVQAPCEFFELCEGSNNE